METQQAASDTDAIVLVALRNEFYRKKYHTVLAVHALSCLVIAILCYALQVYP